MKTPNKLNCTEVLRPIRTDFLFYANEKQENDPGNLRIFLGDPL